MTKKRMILLLGLPAILIVGVGVCLWFILFNQLPNSPQPRVTVENAHQLPAGMTLKEVEAILGRPYFMWGEGGSWTAMWKRNECTIVVSFGYYGERWSRKAFMDQENQRDNDTIAEEVRLKTADGAEIKLSYNRKAFVKQIRELIKS